VTSSSGNDGHSNYGEVEAKTYDELRENESLWHIENAAVELYFRTHTHARILDLPVGTGRFLHCFPKESDVLGIDISEYMLAAARKKRDALGATHVRIEKGDIFALDAEDGTFDAILCFRLLHLLPPDRLTAALKELNRVLKGTLIAQAYVHGTPLRRFASRAAWLVGRTLKLLPPQHPLRSSDHIATWNHSRAQMEAAFDAAGLSVRRDTLIGHYYGHEVRVFLLEPSNGHRQ
jgi:SAM-dependent methyltransferase